MLLEWDETSRIFRSSWTKKKSSYLHCKCLKWPWPRWLGSYTDWMMGLYFSPGSCHWVFFRATHFKISHSTKFLNENVYCFRKSFKRSEVITERGESYTFSVTSGRAKWLKLNIQLFSLLSISSDRSGLKVALSVLGNFRNDRARTPSLSA